MQWFRFYSEALDDPKVQRLPGDLFKAWVNLLCLANEQDERGVLPPLEDIAFRLRVDEGQAADTVGELVRRQLLEYERFDRLVIHAWEKRQKKSDNVNQRVAEWRDRNKQQPPPDDVTLHVTTPQQNSNGPEKKRVEKSRGEESRSIGGAPAPRQEDAPLPPPKFPKPKDTPAPKRPPDELFESVCEACGIDWRDLTDPERGKLNAAVGQIRKAGGTPNTVRDHANNYAQHFSTPLTPSALAGNWAKTANPPPARASPNGHQGKQSFTAGMAALAERYRREEAGESSDVPDAIDVPFVVGAPQSRHRSG